MSLLPSVFPLFPRCVSGLRVLLGSVPAERPPGLRPLWLRCEWNVLQLEELPELVKQAAVRGVNIQLPPVRGRCRGAGVWKGSAAGCARPADSHTETQAAARVQDILAAPGVLPSLNLPFLAVLVCCRWSRREAVQIMRCALTAVPPPAPMCSCPGSACRSSHPASQGCSRQPGTHTGEGPAHERGQRTGVPQGKGGVAQGSLPDLWSKLQLLQSVQTSVPPAPHPQMSPPLRSPDVAPMQPNA